MRAFVPAVSCPSCSYPNDNLFLFCQMCGYRRKTNSQNVPTSKISVDLQAIDNRLEQLKSASLQSAYSKQKCSLRTEFEKFLASLPNSKTILSASPTDINRFLAWKDRHGKTIVHIVMGFPTPTCKVPPSANALKAWHSKKSTPTSEN